MDKQQQQYFLLNLLKGDNILYDSRMPFETSGPNDTWYAFVHYWWKTVCMTVTVMIIAGWSVVWTLKEASKDCEREEVHL